MKKAILTLLFSCIFVVSVSAQTAARVHASEAEQKRESAIALLLHGRSSLGASDPETQAVICPELSMLLLKAGSPEGEEELKACFARSGNIRDAAARRSTQASLAARLLELGKAETQEEVAASMEPGVQAIVREHRMREFLKRGNVEAAAEQLSGFPAAAPLPIPAVVELMYRVPEQDTATRRAIASAVLRHAQQHEGYVMPQLEDLGTFLVRFKDVLPTDVVTAGIDLLLEKARSQDNGPSPIAYHLATPQGQAEFSSTYSLRLFQFLPLLREIDASRAEKIERDNPDLGLLFRRYPRGFSSLDTGYATPDPDARRTMSITYRYKNGQSHDDSAVRQATVMDAVRAVVQSGDKDRKAALRNAELLPLRFPSGWKSPRAEALGNLALRFAASDESAAREALRLLRRTSDELPPITRCHYLTGATNTYLRMTAFDEAQETIDRSLACAAEMLKRDSDSSDPNTAPRPSWPSAAAYRTITLLQLRVDPAKARLLPRSVEDPAIATLMRLTIASDLLGSPMKVFPVQSKFKNEGMHNSFPLSQ